MDVEEQGYGFCGDCTWYKVKGGCNVKRDSPICLLNKVLKENVLSKKSNRNSNV